MHRARLIGAVLTLVAALFGVCAGDDAPTAAPLTTTLRVTAKEMKFSPSTIGGKHGQTTITVHNAGSLTHTFSLNDLGREVTINPGETKQIRLTTQPGSYAYVCRILDHEGLGMYGTLTVT